MIQLPTVGRQILNLMLIPVVLSCSGCERFEQGERKEIAKNAVWTVGVLGDLNSAGPYLGRNIVRFEVRRSGERYASGLLYEAGPHDRSFLGRYDRTDWVSPNVLRFSHIARLDSPTSEIQLRNESTQTVRWLQIKSDDLFLVLGLPPGAAVTFVTSHSEDPRLAVNGEIEGDRVIPRVAEDVQQTWRRIDITVRPSDVLIRPRS